MHRFVDRRFYVAEGPRVPAVDFVLGLIDFGSCVDGLFVGCLRA
jgi:hypothetical protein